MVSQISNEYPETFGASLVIGSLRPVNHQGHIRVTPYYVVLAFALLMVLGLLGAPAQKLGR